MCNQHSITRKWRLVFGSAMLLIALFYADRADSRELLAESGNYIDVYGLVSAIDNPNVERVNHIFDRLKRVVGHAVSSSRLLVIDSPSKPWAIALSDGNVVLSRGAVDLFYSHGDMTTGDSWAAFVLGHELSHLTNRDLWHHQMHLAMSGSDQNAALKDLRSRFNSGAINPELIKNRELKADEQGFIYAALGGYRVKNILNNPSVENSFLAHWVEQTQTRFDTNHHSSAVRTDFLQARLVALSERMQLFDYGVRLAHFGRYEDATYLLQEFLTAYPSRPALNNLAYVNIQLARKKMPAGLAYRFWIPTLLEDDRDLNVERTFALGLPDESRLLLEEARAMLEQASNIEKQDLVSRINLIAAYLYLGEFHRARAVVEEALKMRPNSIQLKGMRALILLEQEPSIDMWPHVNSIMAPLVDSPKAPENLLFNYTKMLIERNRHGKALPYIKKLLIKKSLIPSMYLKQICTQTENPNACLESAAVKNNPKITWNFPVKIGDDIGKKSVRKALDKWTHLSHRYGKLAFDIYTNLNGDSILAIDHKIELMTLKNNISSSTRQLERQAGVPSVVAPFSGRSIWSYSGGWSAVAANSKIEEIWISR